MTWARFINSTRRHARDENGASLVEYTVVIILFLLIFFAILDFGRLGFNWVMTEKAMQRAARIATVRPPVCANVPETHGLAGGSTSDFGTLCRVGSTCVAEPARQCVLGNGDRTLFDCTNVTNTAGEIWCTLMPILPSNATPRNIRLSYRYDQNLGFVGGPYTPMIEVGVVTDDYVAGGTNPIANAQELRFEFITPLPALATLAGGAVTAQGLANDDDSNSLADIPFPDMSVSMPGEDLAQGTNG